MTNRTKGNIIKAGAVLLDVTVPLAATLTQFPIWVEKSSEATMSGLFLVFALLSCIPFIKQIKEFFKSPSVWVLWVVLLVLFVCLRYIIDEMVVVCFFGALSNFVGAGLYKLGDIVSKKQPKIDEEQSEEDN
jgi:phosphatidylserine synthase